MAARVRKCPMCREPVFEKLVFKNGARRRTRVVQCPNHCDLKCPICDELVRVTSDRIHERSLKCKNCEWRGHVPDRQLVKAKDAARLSAHMEKIYAARSREREKRRTEIRKNVDVNKLGSGSRCPFCSYVLFFSKTTKPSLKSGYDEITYRLRCSSTECDSTWWEETKTVLAKVLPYGNDWLKATASKIETKCQSCGQSILYGYRCGCS